MTVCGILLASGFIPPCFSASQRGLLKSLNSPTGCACPMAQLLSSPGGNWAIKTPLHGSKWVVLGRDPRSFRTILHGEKADAAWQCLCVRQMVWEGHQQRPNKALHLSGGCVWSDLCCYCRILHLGICSSVSWPWGDPRIKANPGATHGWLRAPAVLSCSQAQGTPATAQHADEG